MQKKLDKFLSSGAVFDQGAVTFEECIKAIRHLEIQASYEDLLQFFCIIDLDGDGKIDQGQLAQLIYALGKTSPREPLNLLFYCFDFDQKGVLTPTQLKRLLLAIDAERAVGFVDALGPSAETRREGFKKFMEENSIRGF